MNIGKLYQAEKYFWLLYPSKDSAVEYATSYATASVIAARNLVNCIKMQNCNVSIVEPKNMFVLLEQDGEFCKILTANSANGELGWIVLNDWAKEHIRETKS
jgi:hypothetical protein